MMKSNRSKSKIMKNDPTPAAPMSLESSLMQLPTMGSDSPQGGSEQRRPWGAYSSKSVRHSGTKGGRNAGFARSVSERPGHGDRSVSFQALDDNDSLLGGDSSSVLDDYTLGEDSVGYYSVASTPATRSLLGKFGSPDDDSEDISMLGASLSAMSDFDSSTRTRDTFYTAFTTESEPVKSSGASNMKHRKTKIEKIKELQEANKRLQASTRQLQVELEAKNHQMQQLEVASSSKNDDKHVEALMKLTAATKKQQETMQAQQAKYEKAKHQLQKYHKEVKRLRQKVDNNDKEIVDLKRENDGHLAKIAELKKELSRALQQIDSLNEMYESDRAKILNLSKELAQLKSGDSESFDGPQAQAEVFDEEMKRKNKELEAQKAEVANLSARVKQLEEDLEASKVTASELEKDRDRSLELLEKASEKLQKDLEEKTIIFEEAQKDKATLQELDESQSALRTALEEARSELELMKEEKRCAQLSGDEHKVALRELEEEKERLLLNLSTLSEELATARAENESNEESHKAERMRLKGELGSLKQSMAELQSALHEANERNRELNELSKSHEYEDRNRAQEHEQAREKEISNLRSEADKLRRSITDLLDEKSDHRREAEELRRRKAEAESRIDELLKKREQEDSSHVEASQEVKELQKLNQDLEQVVELTTKERDEWKAVADETEARRALAAAEHRQIHEQLEEETKELRRVNEDMEAEIQMLMEDRDKWRNEAKKSDIEASEARVALSLAEKASEESRQAREEAQSFLVTREELNDEIERLTSERDAWKKAAGIAKARSDLDTDSGHSGEGSQADAMSKQALFLQEVAEKQQRRLSDKKAKKGWFGASMSALPLQRGSVSTIGTEDVDSSWANKDAIIEELEEKNESNEETIKQLRSELVRLNASFKEEVYLQRKKIETLQSENEAYKVKVAALEEQFGVNLSSGSERSERSEQSQQS